MRQLTERASEPKLEEFHEARTGAGPRVGPLLRHPVLFTFLVAFVVRCVVAVLFSAVFDGSLVPDDHTYSAMASQLASDDLDNWDAQTHELYRSTKAFLGPVAAIYSVLGPEKLAAQLYVALFGALTAAATTRLALDFLSTRWALVAGLSVGLLPSQVLWSSLVLKDAVVWFGLASLGVVVAVGLRALGFRLLLLGLAAATLLLGLAFLREHTLVVAAFALAIASFAGSQRQRLPRIGGAFAIAIVVPWLVGIGPGGVTLITNAGSLEQRRLFNAEGARSAFIESRPDEAIPPQEDPALTARLAFLETQAAELRLRAEDGGSPASGDQPPTNDARERARVDRILQRAAALERQAEEIRSRLAAETEEPPVEEDAGPLDPNLAHLPTGLGVMLLEPVPWETGGSSTLQMARLEALVWYPLLVLAIIGLWAARHHVPSVAFPLLAGGGMLIVYALTEGNIGTAFRHRGEFVWVVCLLAALGLHRVSLRRQQADRRQEP